MGVLAGWLRSQTQRCGDTHLNHHTPLYWHWAYYATHVGLLLLPTSGFPWSVLSGLTCPVNPTALSAPARPTGRLTDTCKLQLVLYDTSLWAAFIDISCHYVRAVTEHAGSLSPASVSKHRGGFTDCTDARWCEEVPWESWAINNRVCVIYNLRLRKGMRGRWEGVMEMNEPNDEAQTGC